MDQPLDRLRAALADRYTVHREVGRGGMAAVYLADDLKHDRMVALKTIAVEFSTPASAERFQREIRIAARLNHPHILPLYDSGQTDGFMYFTMPFVELPTLRARLVREGRLPVTEAVRVLHDVTEALAYAHERGVVHRDIKPDNVFLLTGHAAVADFGLAKALSEAGAGGTLTTEGATLGTPAYMAPEQVMGDTTSPVDHRADLYALGVMACEILTGSRPTIDTAAEDLLARSEPAGVTPALARVVLRCLARRPADRWQTAAELMPEWERSLTRSDPVTPIPKPSPPRPRRRRAAWIGAVLVVGVSGIVMILTVGRWESAAPVAPVFRQITFVGDVSAAAISPDGQFVAYMAGTALWLQDLAGGEPIRLVDSVSPRSNDPEVLQWSGDGSRIFFVDDVIRPSGAHLVRRLGGAPQHLDMTGFALARLSADGTRYALWAGPGDSVVIRDAVPDNPQTVIRIGAPSEYISDVQWSPDDRGLLLLMLDRARMSLSLRTVPLDGGPQHVVAAEDPGVGIRAVRWPADGRAIYYMRGADEVLRVPVSLQTGESRGPPRVLLNSAPARSISLSAGGTRAVLVRANPRSNLSRVSFGKDGVRETALTRGTWQAFGGRVSPDGRWVAFVAEGDLYRVPAVGGEPRRLTYDLVVTGSPAWSPDATRIAVPVQAGPGEIKIAVLSADGAELRILAGTRVGSGTTAHGVAWAPQREILYPAEGERDYLLVDPESGAERALFDAETKRVVFADSVFGWVYHPEFSPDGLLLAFDGGSGGIRARQSFLWVISVTGQSPRTLWNEALPPNRRRLRNEFAHQPVGWSADSRGVYVHDWHYGVLRLVPIDGGEPRVVADLSPDCVVDWVAPDASSVLCTKDETESDVWMVDGLDPGTRPIAMRDRQP